MSSRYNSPKGEKLSKSKDIEPTIFSVTKGEMSRHGNKRAQPKTRSNSATSATYISKAQKLDTAAGSSSSSAREGKQHHTPSVHAKSDRASSSSSAPVHAGKQHHTPSVHVKSDRASSSAPVHAGNRSRTPSVHPHSDHYLLAYQKKKNTRVYRCQFKCGSTFRWEDSAKEHSEICHLNPDKA
jgi:hypothetical protein